MFDKYGINLRFLENVVIWFEIEKVYDDEMCFELLLNWLVLLVRVCWLCG